MPGNMCANHPTRRALHVCRRCNNPVCDVCTTSFGGRFCSAECANSFQEFQSKVADIPRRRRTRFSLLGCLKTFVISMVLLAVIWFALVQLLGTSDLGQMLVEFRKMWKLAF